MSANWEFNFYNENENIRHLTIDKGTIKSIADCLFKDYNKSIDSISVVFVDDNRLLDMNVTHLGHDYYTDVITFDMSEEEDVIEAEIYISSDRVMENSKQLSISFEEELKRVIIHGFLHLVGINDKSADERKVMHALENKYLFSVSRET